MYLLKLFILFFVSISGRLKIVLFTFTAMTNTTSGSSTQGSNSSNSSRRNNIFYNRRKTPLMTANATEEEVPIQKFRTNRPRRSNEQQQTNLKLNSSQMSSRCPNSLNLTTIRTIHNFSTTLNKNIGTTITIENMLLNLNTTNKMTEILNPKILAENIHFKTIKQFLGKKYENKNILVKKTESNGTRYYNDKSKDEFHTTNQKQKQLYFLKSLIQIYQKLMSNSSSSTHLWDIVIALFIRYMILLSCKS